MDKLKSLLCWTHCKISGNKDKVPALGLGKTKPISYEQAYKNAQNKIAGSSNYGIIFDADSGYFGIDCDVDPTGQKKNTTKEIPQELLFFLMSHQTHIHYSPSGYGIHVIYSLAQSTIDKLKKLNLKQKATNPEKGDLFAGDWRFDKSFLTVTEKLHKLSTKEIQKISYNALIELIPSIGEIKEPPKNTGYLKIEYEIMKSIPSLSELEELLNSIPATFNPIIQRACANLPYSQPSSNYEYWVLVGQICAHHAISLVKCGNDKDSEKVANLYLKWSQRDTEGFVSEEDVFNKFQGFLTSTMLKMDANKFVTTIGTLSNIAKHCRPNFPDKIMRGKTLVPDVSSIKNIDYLHKLDNLQLIFDSMSNGYCFKGPEELITKWFCNSPVYESYRPNSYSQVVDLKSMGIRYRPYMQNRYSLSGITDTTSKAVMEYIAQTAKNTSAFKAWIESKPWDKRLRFKQLYTSIEYDDDKIQNTEIYTKYIKYILMSMIGIHFWPEENPTIPAMLILTGPEHTYKTTWGRCLMPEEMKLFRSEANPLEAVAGRGGNLSTDWLLKVVSKAVILLDECEDILSPKYEAQLKANIDSTLTDIRVYYTQIVKQRQRTAILIGTTNKSDIFTGNTGTRKIWQIPVKKCNTDLLFTLDFQQVYAEVYQILKQLKKDSPNEPIQTHWLLNEQERELTNDLNFQQKGKDLGVMGLLIEKFGDPSEIEFDPKDWISNGKPKYIEGKSGNISTFNITVENYIPPNIWNVRNITKYLEDSFSEYADRNKVKYALEEYSTQYTNTLKAKYLFKSYATKDTRLYNLSIRNGKIKRNHVWFYMMPPPIITQENEED